MTRPAPLPPAGFSSQPPLPVTRADVADPVRERVLAILADLGHLPGALLPVLHAVQDALGCVPPQVVPLLASGLNLSRAEVHGVITFYPHFRSVPTGQHHIELCRAEACQAMGANALVAHAQQRLACTLQATSPDGRYTLDPVYCLGLCAQSPAMLVNGQPHARLSPERFDHIIANLEAST